MATGVIERSGLRRDRRRSKLLRRAGPLGVLAVVAFVGRSGAGGRIGRGRAPARVALRHFLGPRRLRAHVFAARRPSQRRLSQSQFVQALDTAAATATLLSIRHGNVGSLSSGSIPVRMRVRTRVFGTLAEVLRVPLTGSGSTARIHFSTALLFPGLRAGEQLTRDVTLASRGDLLARDGTALAQGAARTSPIPDVAGQIIGTLGPIPAADASTYAAKGYPTDAHVGLNGLERVFQDQLAGTPGGRLLAGRRSLATVSTDRWSDRDHHHQPGARAGGGDGDGGPVCRDRRDGSAHRRVAGPGRRRLLRPPASRLDDEDHHRHRRAGGRNREAGRRVPDPDLGHARGLQPPERERRGMRRDLPERLRRLVQLGVRPARGKARRRAAGRHRAAVWLQPNSVDSGRLRADDSLRQDHRRPARGRLLGHRAGHGPEHRAGDDRRRRDDRDGGPAADPHLGTPRPAAFRSRGEPSRRPSRSAADDRGRRVRNRHRGPDPRRHRGGEDGHGGVAQHRRSGTASSPANTDSWFVGYAPAGHPRIVVGALFPAQGAGATTAAPAVREVLVAGLAAH